MSQLDWSSEDDHSVAMEIALEAELLARCPECRDVYDPLSNNFEAAYRLANSMITRGDPLVVRYSADRTQLTDAIKGVCKPYPDHCRCGASGRKTR